MACAAAVGVCPGGGVGASSAQARRWAVQGFKPWSLRRPQGTILMGFDQHRAQITPEGGFAGEEQRPIDARVHLAEPAETAARRGTKRRPKSDRADARHLRELLMIGRLPESWIPPDYLLDLRSKVRLRHTLVDQS